MITNNQKLIIDQITSEFEKMNKQSKTIRNKYFDFIKQETDAFNNQLEQRRISTYAYNKANIELMEQFVGEVEKIVQLLGGEWALKVRTNTYQKYTNFFEVKIESPYQDNSRAYGNQDVSVEIKVFQDTSSNSEYYLTKSGLSYYKGTDYSRKSPFANEEEALQYISEEIVRLIKRNTK
jgi:DnaJ-class molecular chaperone